MTEYPTSIGTSTSDSIFLLGQNLTKDVIGQRSFASLAFRLISGENATPAQARVFDAILVALADHGFTPTAIAARMTYYSAPESLQGALASGLLGGGSRFLGVTEDTGRFLSEMLADQRGFAYSWDGAAREALLAARHAGRRIPGLGHPVHKQGDPRTPVLIALAHEEGVAGDHLALLQAIERVHPEVLGKRLPLNGAGVCGAILADVGFPVDMLRGVALLARTAGLLGHIAEEQRRPVAPSIYMEVDRNAVYLAD